MRKILIDQSLPEVYSVNGFLDELIMVIMDPTRINIEFWYIYMIVAFYLMLPLLYKMIKNLSEKDSSRH